jgi:hypothetical protein
VSAVACGEDRARVFQLTCGFNCMHPLGTSHQSWLSYQHTSEFVLLQHRSHVAAECAWSTRAQLRGRQWPLLALFTSPSTMCLTPQCVHTACGRHTACGLPARAVVQRNAVGGLLVTRPCIICMLRCHARPCTSLSTSLAGSHFCISGKSDLLSSRSSAKVQAYWPTCSKLSPALV